MMALLDNKRFVFRYHYLFSFIFFVILVVALYSPVIYKLANLTGELSDYAGHHKFIIEMLEKKTVVLPHFLFHAITATVYKINESMGLASASTIVASAAYLITLLTVYIHLSCSVLSESFCWKIFVPFISVCVVIAAPVALLAVIDGHMYLGYIGISTYHNPTMTLLKPLALIHFFMTVKMMESRQATAMHVIGLIIVSILVALAKPNYTLVMLPVVLIYLAYICLTRQRANAAAMAISVIVPSVVVLASQFFLFFTDDKIQFAPFVVPAALSSMLFPKFILSMAFPLSVSLLYLKKVMNDLHMKTAWAIFMFGIAQMYLLAESGQRMFHGNFFWSGQIALFILFVATTRFMVREQIIHKKLTMEHAKKHIDFRLLFSWMIFISHAIFGVLWFYFDSLGPRVYW